METTALTLTCAMCSGKFPGPGIEVGGKRYCCDKCADFSQNKSHMVAAMAPKVLGVLALGAVLGYLVGWQRQRW